MKKFLSIALMNLIYLANFAQNDTIPCTIYQNNCNVGIGVPYPGEKLHLGDGNFLIEGGGETAIIMKRDVSFTSIPSGTSKNPTFYFGRIVQAGDGDPEFRFLYKDDSLGKEIPIFEFDRKGIIASVKPAPPSEQYRGSHFEGFFKDAQYPYFRLNSYPRMRLEMGEGGNEDVDVAVERFSKNMIGFYTGKVCHMVIDSTGRVGIGTQIPNSKLEVNGFIHSTSLGIKFPDNTVQSTASLWSSKDSNIYYRSGNVGFGTDTPTSKVEIAKGDMLINCDTCGLILTSPNGKKWKITVDNNGNLLINGKQEQSTSLKAVAIDEGVNIFPNPSNDLITVEIPDKDIGVVYAEINNSDGKMIFMKQYNSNLFNIDLSDFSNGLYFISIKNKNGQLIQTKKIIKK